MNVIYVDYIKFIGKVIFCPNNPLKSEEYTYVQKEDFPNICIVLGFVKLSDIAYNLYAFISSTSDTIFLCTNIYSQQTCFYCEFFFIFVF